MAISTGRPTCGANVARRELPDRLNAEPGKRNVYLNACAISRQRGGRAPPRRAKAPVSTRSSARGRRDAPKAQKLLHQGRQGEPVELAGWAPQRVRHQGVAIRPAFGQSELQDEVGEAMADRLRVQ